MEFILQVQVANGRRPWGLESLVGRWLQGAEENGWLGLRLGKAARLEMGALVYLCKGVWVLFQIEAIYFS